MLALISKLMEQSSTRLCLILLILLSALLLESVLVKYLL